MKLDITTYDNLHKMLQEHGLFLGECALPDSEDIGVIVCPKRPNGKSQTIAVRITGIRYGHVTLEASGVCRDVEIWSLGKHPQREQTGHLGWDERPQRKISTGEVERFAERSKQIFDTG